MPRHIAISTLALLPLLVAACGTPQERCIGKHTREYRNVSNLLQQVEANLERGYAWEERQVVRDRLTHCRDYYRDSDGNTHVTTRPCWRDYVDIERYRVPIDPAAEQRKRDGLAARKAELQGTANAYVQACKKAFPEEKN